MSQPSAPDAAAGRPSRGALRRPTRARTAAGLALHLLALAQGVIWLQAGDTWRGGALVTLVLCSLALLARGVRPGGPASIPTQRAAPLRLDPSGLDRDLHDR